MDALILTLSALALGAVTGWLIPIRGHIMEWKTEEQRAPRDRRVLHNDNVMLTVSDAKEDSHATWQSAEVRVGQFSELPVDDCLAGFPREALALLRQELDKFEASLSPPTG